MPFLQSTVNPLKGEELMPRKQIVFIASAKKALKNMPEDVQDSFGFKVDRASGDQGSDAMTLKRTTSVT